MYLCQIRDDFPALHSGVVVLVDQQRLDDDQDLVDVGPHQVVQFVQDAVNDLDQKVTLLVLQGRGHQEGQDLIEKRPRPKLARLVCDLSEGSLWKKRGLQFQTFEQKPK